MLGGMSEYVTSRFSASEYSLPPAPSVASVTARCVGANHERAGRDSTCPGKPVPYPLHRFCCFRCGIDAGDIQKLEFRKHSSLEMVHRKFSSLLGCQLARNPKVVYGLLTELSQVEPVAPFGRHRESSHNCSLFRAPRLPKPFRSRN